MQATVAERILEYAQGQPEGTVLGAKELLHLAARPAVDQALRRLAGKNELLKLYRGAYVRPVETKFGRRAPEPAKVVESIRRTQAETVVPHGASEAHALGLTTQVPTRIVYLTSGKSRTLMLGAQVIKMKHAPRWMLMASPGGAGRVVRALEWLGERRASAALMSLKQTLPLSQVQELVMVRPALPRWLAKSIGEALVAHG
ncbi:DUF6088 family protein [Bradyrhizobium sp.]|uniref:DUF6088 family protein n=1 Tax=Bradyrhizobium sp. TaxID=376 RepID=UPI002733486B|nr:DUF6088 family protein [Bradyrhizobium sp.]MDP3077199.1 DUF6088 family protein [Bradyrhizobium sp.]